MPFEHRKQMCELALIDYPWIFTSDFECASAPMFGELIVHEKEYKKYFNKRKGNPIHKKRLQHIKRINCMGADKVLISADVGVWTFVANIQSQNTMNVSIGRKGYMDNVQKVYDHDLKNGKVDTNKFLLIDVNVPSFSSTQIRRPLLNLYKRMYVQPCGHNDKEVTDESKDNTNDSQDIYSKSVEELQVIFKNETKESLPGSVSEYLIKHLNDDLWMTEDYFEKKKKAKQVQKSNNNSAKKSSWFSSFSRKKT